MDLYGATNLIPGPNSTELAIHISNEYGGLKGLFLGGFSFIIPAMLIVLFLAVAYTKYGALPELSGILVGIKPVIISIVSLALYRLGKNLLKNTKTILFFLVALILYFLGIKELILLFSSGLLMYLINNFKEIKNKIFTLSFLSPLLMLSSTNTNDLKIGNYRIFLIFLKIGSVLYGSGYVLLAFLESEFVDKLQLITKAQLIDAVAVGQFTPGPVFTTATFIGYLINGFSGSILATIGIFLPSFLLVWWLNPLIPKLRNSKIFSNILDGVNLSSLALMAAVTIKLGISSIINYTTSLICLISFFILYKTKINSAFLIIIGGIIGYFL